MASEDRCPQCGVSVAFCLGEKCWSQPVSHPWHSEICAECGLPRRTETHCYDQFADSHPFKSIHWTYLDEPGHEPIDRGELPNDGYRE